MSDNDGNYDKNGFRLADAFHYDAELGSWVWEETFISDENLEQQEREIETADLDFLREVGIEIPESSSDAKKTQR